MVPAAIAAEPFPQFAYEGVITDKDEMIYNPTDEFIFPSVFHAGAHFEDPLGEWYLYLAPHDSPAGVMLMYADSLDGPWTEYTANPIIASEWAPYYDVSHVSSPDAIWNAEAGELFLYFHGENSVTRYASSSDGIHFDYGDVVVSNAMGGPDVTETSYARVFEIPTRARATATACSTWPTSPTTTGASSSPSRSTASPMRDRAPSRRTRHGPTAATCRAGTSGSGTTSST